MGNWRNRPPRRFFYQQRFPKSPPRSSYDQELPSSGFCEDGVPPWEKKFCTMIGSVPWWKVVDAKKFMYCHGNVLNWDDSAGREAFHNAKKRFWAEINGLSCDISLPDPDTFIDEINWSPIIDPELIEDLEREYFAPDEGEKDGKAGRKNKKSRNSQYVPLEGCNQNSDNVGNPWECNYHAQGSDLLKNKSQGWSHWGSNNNELRNSNNGEKPWECSFTQGNEAAKDTTWGDCSNKVWDWNQRTNSVDQSRDWDNSDNLWEHSCKGNGSAKDKGWGNLRDNSWGVNWQESRKLDSGYKPWEPSLFPGSGIPKDRGWKDGGANAWGWENSETYNPRQRKLEFIRSGEGWGSWNGGYRKREGSHQYTSGYKSSRFQRDNNQTDHGWRTEKANKRAPQPRMLLDSLPVSLGNDVPLWNLFNI